MDSLVLRTVGSITNSIRKIGEFELGIKKMGNGTGLWGFRCAVKSLQEKVTLRSKNNLLEFYYDAKGLEQISEEELFEGIRLSGNTNEPYFDVYIKALGDDTLFIKAEIGSFQSKGRLDANCPLLQLDTKVLGYYLTVEGRSPSNIFLAIGSDQDYTASAVQPQYEIINGTVEDLAIVAMDRSNSYANTFNFSGSNNTLKGSMVACINKFKGFGSYLNCIGEKGIDEECINPIVGLPYLNGNNRGYSLHIVNSNLYLDLDQPISKTGNIEDALAHWCILNGTKSRGDLSVAKNGIARLWADYLAEGYSFSWKGGPDYSWNKDAVNFGSEVRIDMKMAPSDEIDDFIVSLSKSPKVVSTSKISIKGNCSYTNPSSLRHEEVVNAVNTIKLKGATLNII